MIQGKSRGIGRVSGQRQLAIQRPLWRDEKASYRQPDLLKD
jgi:hypothetical protein